MAWYLFINKYVDKLHTHYSQTYTICLSIARLMEWGDDNVCRNEVCVYFLVVWAPGGTCNLCGSTLHRVTSLAELCKHSWRGGLRSLMAWNSNTRILNYLRLLLGSTFNIFGNIPSAFPYTEFQWRNPRNRTECIRVHVMNMSFTFVIHYDAHAPINSTRSSAWLNRQVYAHTTRWRWFGMCL